MLLGDDGWVVHREAGVVFELDVTRCMYSSGNVTERTRMGAMPAAGETVVDLFTGIGYYTLPLLVNAHVAKVGAGGERREGVSGLDVRAGSVYKMPIRGVARGHSDNNEHSKGFDDFMGTC